MARNNGGNQPTDWVKGWLQLEEEGKQIILPFCPKTVRKLINNHFMHGNASLSPMWQQTNSHLPNLVHLHLSQVKAFCSLHLLIGERGSTQPTIGANQIHSLPARNLFFGGDAPVFRQKIEEDRILNIKSPKAAAAAQ